MNEIDVVKKMSKEAYVFLTKLQHEKIENGRYDLGEDVYANVESYISQGRSEKQFENHKKYIDIQLIIEGEELIEVSPVMMLKQTLAYDLSKDISWYDNSIKGKEYYLGKGDFLIIYPGQAHMPCLKVEKETLVRKAVIKVPVKVLPPILFMDVDRTLTDEKIYIGKDGEILKVFDVKDGYAIAHILPQNGIVPVIITGKELEIVANRCNELKIKYIFQNIRNKKEKMVEFANSFGIYADENGKLPNTSYFGDDIPDYECMLIAEKKGCPQDAVEEIKKICDFISNKKEGEGAVREFIDWLIEARTG